MTPEFGRLNSDYINGAWVADKRKRRPMLHLRVPLSVFQNGTTSTIYTQLATVRERNDKRWQWQLRSDKVGFGKLPTSVEGTVATPQAAIEACEQRLVALPTTTVITLAPECVRLRLSDTHPGKGVCLELCAPNTRAGHLLGEQFQRAAYAMPRETGWFHQGGLKPDGATSNWYLFEFWKWSADPHAVIAACHALETQLQLHLDIEISRS